MRKVIVHYHLFKNAGSSVDGLLSNSFGDKWHAFDPTNPAGKVSADNLSGIIEQKSEYDAFSSHCIVPPLPEGNFKVFPLVVLRDPIARVMSAYSFEWTKQLGLDKAKGTLTEYIRDKFDKPRANAIEDFQTLRLAVSDASRTSPMMNLHDEQILVSAQEFISDLPAFGLVEDFSSSLTLFQDYLQPHFPEMAFDGVAKDVTAKNVTQDISVPIYERHEAIKTMIGTDTFEELVKRNQLDIKLHAYAQGRFAELKRRSMQRHNEEDANRDESVSDVQEVKSADVASADQSRANA